jgi:hypothetical protein
MTKSEKKNEGGVGGVYRNRLFEKLLSSQNSCISHKNQQSSLKERKKKSLILIRAQQKT